MTTSLRFLRDRLTADLKKRLLRQSYIPQAPPYTTQGFGSASGFMIKTKKEIQQLIFAIPGVPREMKICYEAI
jgi:molybdopterin-biosynthesis enzyme MoeA-like protein